MCFILIIFFCKITLYLIIMPTSVTPAADCIYYKCYSVQYGETIWRLVFEVVFIMITIYNSQALFVSVAH